MRERERTGKRKSRGNNSLGGKKMKMWGKRITSGKKEDKELGIKRGKGRNLWGKTKGREEENRGERKL